MIHDETLTIKRKSQKGNALDSYSPVSLLIDMKHRGRYDLMWARLEPWKNEERE